MGRRETRSRNAKSRISATITFAHAIFPHPAVVTSALAFHSLNLRSWRRRKAGARHSRHDSGLRTLRQRLGKLELATRDSGLT
jgi:hypothetical protein